MRATREIIREEISVLVHLNDAGTAGRELKPLCLQLIDRVARWAADVHREIPDNVLVHLTSAMRAAGREDVAGVIVAVETAVTQIGKIRAATT